MDNNRSKVICFPTKKSPVGVWIIKNGVKEKGAFGEVSQVCYGNDCDYVIKIIRDTDHDLIKREVRFQNLCASFKLCKPVEDWWLCNTEEGKGGVIITPILKETFADRVGPLNYGEKYWEYIKRLLALVLDLHQEGIAHFDSHYKNIMFDSDDRLYFIDMGASQEILKNDQEEAFIQIRADYYKIAMNYAFYNDPRGDILYHIRSRIEKYLDMLVPIMEAEKMAITEILNMSYEDTLDETHGRRSNQSTEFVDIDGMKEALRNRECKTEGNINKFIKWAEEGDWEKFNPQYNQYEWWMFPINRHSSKGYMYTVFREDIEDLSDDSEYIDDYRLGAILLAKSWGWDLEREKFVDEPSSTQQWRNWDMGLKKLSLSLKLFDQEDLFDNLRPFVEYLLKNDTLKNNKEKNEIKAIYNI